MISESARAITSGNLKRLYEVNMGIPEISYQERCELFAQDPNRYWGGRKVRMLLQCVYIIAFLCLLRSDEVFRIRFEDIEVVDKITGHIILHLPFRKTHQNGGKFDFIEGSTLSRDFLRY